MSGVNPSTGFTQVTPTAEEIADWRKKHPRRSPPYRSKCMRCGTRIWHSGIGVGAHRRACKGIPTLPFTEADEARYQRGKGLLAETLASMAGPQASDCAACRTGKGRHTCGLAGLQNMFRIG